MTSAHLADMATLPGDVAGADQRPVGATELAVVEPDRSTADRMAAHLRPLVEPFVYPSAEALVARASDAMPGLVIFGPSCADLAKLHGLCMFDEAYPDVIKVLVVEFATPELVAFARACGIADVMTLDELIDQVASASDVAADTGTEEGQEAGRVITVVSPKGGAGKSMVATNLAICLASETDGAVCLVDADLQFGDDAVMLMISPQFTIADAARAGGNLDKERLSRLVAKHPASGLSVLAAPTEPWLADEISADDVVQVLGLLRQSCSHVVVDTSSHFGELVIRVLEASDDIVFVASMDLPNIKTAKLGLQTLRVLGLPDERVRLVLNRANSVMPMDLEKVQEVVGATAVATIPSDMAIVHSVNKGVPVVLSAPKSGAAKSLRQLGRLFVEKAAPQGPARRR